MSITKFPGHIRNIKLNFSANVLTLGLKAKMCKSFGGTAHAPHVLTAVMCVIPNPNQLNCLTLSANKEIPEKLLAYTSLTGKPTSPNVRCLSLH